MTDPTDGGTVRYHRADYNPATDEPWLVWFTEDQADPYWFTAEQGEAMGLTVPEPAPLAPVDVIAGIGVKFDGDKPVEFLLDRYDASVVIDALDDAGYDVVLRDARQDPQPAADDTPSDDIDFNALPIGTVLRDKWGDLLLRREGGWFEGDDDCFPNAEDGSFTVVYQPAPLSPGEVYRMLDAALAAAGGGVPEEGATDERIYDHGEDYR